MAKEKRIIKLDASSLKESSCDLRLWNLIVEGYRGGIISNDLLYGSAVHKFIEVMYRSGGNLKDAVFQMKQVFDKPCHIKPTKKHLTLLHLTKTCIDLWQEFLEKDDFEHFHFDETNSPAVEITFSIQIYEDDNIIIKLEGTIDKLGKIKNGCYAVGDYKTTASWNTQDYFEGFRLSPQLKTYVYAIKKMASMNPNSPIAKICETPIGAFIDGIFLSSSKPSTFKRSEVTIFKDEQLDEYEKLLNRVCEDIGLQYSNYLVSGEIPVGNGLINGSCETKFGRCRFFNICASPDKVTQQHLLKRDFLKKNYEPLMFGKD